MENTGQAISITISLRNMRVDGFELSDVTKDLNEQVPFDEYEYIFEPQLTIKKELKEVDVLVTTFVKDKRDGSELATFITSFVYRIENIDELITIDSQGSIIVPTVLAPLLIGSSVSTTRGLFAPYVANTKINNSIIPIVDANSFNQLQTVNNTE
jgi:hypothetical protein